MITAKVAKILNEFQLVLNVGAQQGVKKGMQFIIFEEGEEIKDPQSGSSLGRMELVKGEVEVTHVQDALCLVQSKAIQKEAAPTVLSAKLAEVTPSAKSKLEKDFHRLYVKQSDITGLPTARPISVGDLARNVD